MWLSMTTVRIRYDYYSYVQMHFSLSFDFLFFLYTGGRVAHGCYGKHRSKRNVSSQFHSANVKNENLFLVLYNNFY